LPVKKTDQKTSSLWSSLRFQLELTTTACSVENLTQCWRLTSQKLTIKRDFVTFSQVVEKTIQMTHIGPVN